MQGSIRDSIRGRPQVSIGDSIRGRLRDSTIATTVLIARAGIIGLGF